MCRNARIAEEHSHHQSVRRRTMTEQDYIPDWYIPPMSDRDKMKFTTW